jgi:hypothetical protein
MASESGQAILVALIMVTVIATLAGTAIVRTSGTARISARATDYAEVERVSDGSDRICLRRVEGCNQEKGGALTSTQAGELTVQHRLLTVCL